MTEYASKYPEVQVVPLTLKTANDFVAAHHRHHRPVVGHRFSIGAASEGMLVGVAIVGRPVARVFDDGLTAEVTRLATDGTQNTCSLLYAACWRAWRAMGGHRLVTYTLASESGASLRAAGWRVLYETKERPQGWDTPSRRRQSGPQVAKTLWEAPL
jgi:hypothetical protein